MITKFQISQLGYYELVELRKHLFSNGESIDETDIKLIDNLMHYYKQQTVSAMLCISYIAQINHPILKLSLLN